MHYTELLQCQLLASAYMILLGCDTTTDKYLHMLVLDYAIAKVDRYIITRVIALEHRIQIENCSWPPNMPTVCWL